MKCPHQAGEDLEDLIPLSNTVISTGVVHQQRTTKCFTEQNSLYFYTVVLNSTIRHPILLYKIVLCIILHCCTVQYTVSYYTVVQFSILYHTSLLYQNSRVYHTVLLQRTMQYGKEEYIRVQQSVNRVSQYYKLHCSQHTPIILYHGAVLSQRAGELVQCSAWSFSVVQTGTVGQCLCIVIQ